MFKRKTVTIPSKHGLSEEDMLILFIGPGAEDFLPAYRAIKKKKRLYFNINLPFFLLPIVWTLYRKFYLFLFALIIIHSLKLLLPDLNNFTLMVIFMFRANELYIEHALHRIKKISSLDLTTDAFIDRLTSAGGTSTLGAATGIVITIFLIAWVITILHPTSRVATSPEVKGLEQGVLPQCNNARVHATAKELMSYSHKTLNKPKLSDFAAFMLFDNTKKICSFTLEENMQRMTYYALLSWRTEDQLRYKVTISTSSKELMQYTTP